MAIKYLMYLEIEIMETVLICHISGCCPLDDQINKQWTFMSYGCNGDERLGFTILSKYFTCY